MNTSEKKKELRLYDIECWWCLSIEKATNDHLGVHTHGCEHNGAMIKKIFIVKKKSYTYP